MIKFKEQFTSAVGGGFRIFIRNWFNYISWPLGPYQARTVHWHASGGPNVPDSGTGSPSPKWCLRDKGTWSLQGGTSRLRLAPVIRLLSSPTKRRQQRRHEAGGPKRWFNSWTIPVRGKVGSSSKTRNASAVSFVILGKPTLEISSTVIISSFKRWIIDENS